MLAKVDAMLCSKKLPQASALQQVVNRFPAVRIGRGRRGGGRGGAGCVRGLPDGAVLWVAYGAVRLRVELNVAPHTQGHAFGSTGLSFVSPSRGKTLSFPFVSDIQSSSAVHVLWVAARFVVIPA